MIKASAKLLFLLGGTALFVLATAGCDQRTGAAQTTQAASSVDTSSAAATTGSLSDAPLAAYQRDLLDLAFEAVSAMPLDPHIKNRSRAQDVVVTVCLELDQPQRALACAERIENWQRGSGYAAYAFYCAEHGVTGGEIQRYLDLAEKIAAGEEDWRRDRIRSQIAKTYFLLGDTVRADEIESGVVASEAGKLAMLRAKVADENTLDQQMSELDAAVASANFDLMRSALHAYAELFNRFYDNHDRRLVIQARIKDAAAIMPVMIQVESLMSLADFALAHQDQETALKLVTDARSAFDGVEWTAEDKIPLMARLASLRYRAGETDQARGDLDVALALFDSKRDSIMSMDRAGAIRPIAEAYQAMNDTPRALAMYKKVVEEGAINRNSRPRSVDLSATCCSMAVNKIESDEELWIRIRQIREGLGQPW